MNYKLHFLKPFLAFLGVLVLCMSLSGCGGGNEATATTNVAPTANPGPSQNVVVGAVVSMDGSASKDSDGGSLTFKWTLIGKPNASAASLTNPTYPNPKFTADFAGNYVVSLVVNDSKVDSSNTSSITVIASAANSAPVANAGPAQTVTRASGTITVSLTAAGSTDANSDTLTYAWTTAYQPPTSSIALSSATAVSPTFAATVAGVYVFNLIVNDGKVGSAVATVAITVN